MQSIFALCARNGESWHCIIRSGVQSASESLSLFGHDQNFVDSQLSLATTNDMMATAVLSIKPTFIILVLVQRDLVKGLIFGALKG